MRFSLINLFSILYNRETLDHMIDLFGFHTETDISIQKYVKEDIDFLSEYFNSRFNICTFNENIRNFYELSPDVFSTFVHAWMSELPIEKELIAFGYKVIAKARASGNLLEKRHSAEKAASDRGDENTLSVLNACAQVQFEIHRMMGLLRFFPDENGTYTALFSPDHFILPALGGYFKERFGDTAWVIIDEKRNLCLQCLAKGIGNQVKLVSKEDHLSSYFKKSYETTNIKSDDEWEELWKHYHKTINNENRKNTGLQRQLMPKRYWKYLPEM